MNIGPRIHEKLREYRARIIFDFVFRDRYINERTNYLNMGYWGSGAKTLDEASEALAGLVGEEAALGPGDRVLDAGCGFADQDIFFLRRFRPARITGLNVSRYQVRHATAEARRQRVADSLEFVIGSATDMPFDAATFDKVTCVESIQDFPSRPAFFAESRRVLRPGGRLALCDMVPVPGAARDAGEADAVPGYRRALTEAGFADVQVRSIGAHVFQPYREYLAARLGDASVRRRLSPILRHVLRGVARDPYRGGRWDYVLASGNKPGAAPSPLAS